MLDADALAGPDPEDRIASVPPMGETPNLPVPQATIAEICAARDAALARIREAASTIARGFALSAEADKLARRAHHGACAALCRHTESEHYDRLFGRFFDPERSVEVYRKSLDAATWSYLIDHCGFDRLMDLTARRAFEASLLGDVPEIEENTVRATLVALMGDAGTIFRRGLAIAFSKLDRRFRSHDGFKLGSRVILDRVFDEYGHWNYGSDMRHILSDIERVFAVIDGASPNFAGLVHRVDRARASSGTWGRRQFECESRYFRIRGFKNGNAHLWFARDDLVERANKLLAAFYGEVIGDAMAKDATAEELKRGTTEVARDLQFYPTPEEVVRLLVRDLPVPRGGRVLEPSAGNGNIAKALAGRDLTIDCIEVHAGRARATEALGLETVSVRCANFLRVPAEPIYDAVVMNPPFSGTHWMDHVRHAFDCLKPGGVLRAVLPATAELSTSRRHEAFRLWLDSETDAPRSYRGRWEDLPEESFAEAGTRINTVILSIRKRHA